MYTSFWSFHSLFLHPSSWFLALLLPGVFFLSRWRGYRERERRELKIVMKETVQGSRQKVNKTENWKKRDERLERRRNRHKVRRSELEKRNKLMRALIHTYREVRVTNPPLRWEETGEPRGARHRCYPLHHWDSHIRVIHLYEFGLSPPHRV